MHALNSMCWDVEFGSPKMDGGDGVGNRRKKTIFYFFLIYDFANMNNYCASVQRIEWSGVGKSCFP